MPTTRYQPFYCEENIWHLCQEPQFERRPRSVVFVSNPTRTVAVWHQRAAPGAGEAVVWDYHVVLLLEDRREVWDLDTDLGMPIDVEPYLERSFRPNVEPALLPSFRLVAAETFVGTFASDRSHMRLADGTFTAKPPPWTAIGAPGAASNLMRFVDMSRPFVGEVVDLEGLRRRPR